MQYPGWRPRRRRAGFPRAAGPLHRAAASRGSRRFASQIAGVRGDRPYEICAFLTTTAAPNLPSFRRVAPWATRPGISATTTTRPPVGWACRNHHRWRRRRHACRSCAKDGWFARQAM